MKNNRYEELFLTTTDTITGLGAPVSKANFDAIIDLKGRDPLKPLIIMVGSMKQAEKLKGWDKKATELAKEFWPGQVTLVLSDKIAVRMPAILALRDLIIKKGPVYMTSANISGEKVKPFSEAKEIFYEVSSYYDFGPGTGKASKIIDVATGEVLRK